MRKLGFFIGFLSEGETQGDSQTAEIFRRLKELEKRSNSNRLSILLSVAGIALTLIGLIVDIAFRLLGR